MSVGTDSLKGLGSIYQSSRCRTHVYLLLCIHHIKDYPPTVIPAQPVEEITTKRKQSNLFPFSIPGLDNP